MVSGQLSPPPEENCPPVRDGVWVKVRVSFMVGGLPDNCLKENCPRLRLGLGLGLVMGLGCNFPGGQ